MSQTLHSEAAPFGSIPRAQRRAGHLAAWALCLVLVALLGCGLLGFTAVWWQGKAAAQAAQARDRFDRVPTAMLAARALDREHRLSPRPDIRARHRDAVAAMTAALRDVALLGARERLAIGEVQPSLAAYVTAAARVAAAQEMGDAVGAEAADGAELGPAYLRLETGIAGLAAAFRNTAAARLDSMRWLQQGLMVTAPLGAVGGLGLAGVCGLVLRRSQRRLEAALIQEATALCEAERRFRSLVQAAPDMILLCAGPGIVMYQSPAAERIWGYKAQALHDQSILSLAHPEDQPALQAVWERLAAGQGADPTALQRIEVRLRDGAAAWRNAEISAVDAREDPVLRGIVVTVRDVSARRASELMLAEQAFYDAATRLPNGRLFRDRLEQAFARAGRQDGVVAMLSIALHAAGPAGSPERRAALDALAVEAGARLRASVRAQDTVARLADDVFAVVHEFKAGQGDPEAVAQAVAEQFQRPFHVAGREVVVPASIGLALGAARQHGVDSLMRNAEAAAHQARAAQLRGTGMQARYAVFEPTQSTGALDRVELAADLAAIDPAREMLLHYQPIVLVASGELDGVEALVRWQHPVHGLVSPVDLMPIAEETGLIVPLGRWVLMEGCRQIVEWQGQFHFEPPLTLSVNLSLRQFAGSTLVDDVAQALEATGLPPECLKLEVTEAALMTDLDATVQTLWALKRMGVQLAVDDFGTGYSSLSYLKQLPLDLLKIHGTLISGVAAEAGEGAGREGEDAAIVRAMMASAAAMGLAAVAEGVETGEQAAWLAQAGCRFAQGYYYSRALDRHEATALLASAFRDAPGGRQPAGQYSTT